MIRRLGPDDASLLKELRLGALAEAPAAFRTTHDQAARTSEGEWRVLLAPDANPTFVWEDEDGPQGMVVATVDDRRPAVVHLVAMWVRPAARGRGVADGLVDRVLEWARSRSASHVRLEVTAGNGRAERLYARHGFVRVAHDDPEGPCEIAMEVRL